MYLFKNLAAGKGLVGQRHFEHVASHNVNQ